MTTQELYAWINAWRTPRDGWAYPNRMLYMLTELLCDFELDDLNPEVMQALASPIPEHPPLAGIWEALRGHGRSATEAVLDGLVSGAIEPMMDIDNIRLHQGILKRDVQ